MNVWDIEQHAKEHGQSLAAAAHNTDLRIARQTAKDLARALETISSDDVRLALTAGSTGVVWGNWAGNLFSGPEWQHGGYVKSTHTGGHRRRIMLWRLR